MSIILIGFILKKPLWGILFLTFFMPIRIFASGYHAKTYFRCFICTNMVYLISCMLSVFFTHHLHVGIIIFFLSAFYILFNAPMDDEKHRLGEKKKHLNKIRTVKCLLIEILILLLSYRLKIYSVLSIATSTTFLVAAMMFIKKIKEVK